MEMFSVVYMASGEQLGRIAVHVGAGVVQMVRCSVLLYICTEKYT